MILFKQRVGKVIFAQTTGGLCVITPIPCEGPFLDNTQAQVETRILGPLLVVLVDCAWFTAAKWG